MTPEMLYAVLLVIGLMLGVLALVASLLMVAWYPGYVDVLWPPA